MAGPGWQTWGGGEHGFGFCTGTLVTLCSFVPIIYAGVFRPFPLLEWVGASRWEPSFDQMEIPAPGRLVLLTALGALGLGSIVKLPLESSIALATIYFCRPRRKLSCLRYFPPGPLTLGAVPYKRSTRWMLMGKKLHWTQFFSNASAVNQNNSLKKCFTACRFNPSSTFSYYVRQSESASIWLYWV